MHRRGFLVTTSTGATFALAGCLDRGDDDAPANTSEKDGNGGETEPSTTPDEDGNGGETEPSTTPDEDGNGGETELSNTPDEAVQAFFEAANRTDMLNHTHPESDFNISPPDLEQFFDAKRRVTDTEVTAVAIDGPYLESEQLEPSELSIDDIDTIAATENVSLVDMQIEVTAEGQTQEGSVEVITATDGDRWYVLDGVNEETTIVPQVAFDSDLMLGDSSSLLPIDHENASFVEISHQSGDQVATDNLAIAGDNLAYPDGSRAITGRVSLSAVSTLAPDSSFSAGDSFRVNLDESGEPRAYELDLIWESPDDLDASIIYETNGPDA